MLQKEIVADHAVKAGKSRDQETKGPGSEIAVAEHESMRHRAIRGMGHRLFQDGDLGAGATGFALAMARNESSNFSQNVSFVGAPHVVICVG